MPIRSAIWKVSPQPQPLVESSLANERLLEDLIVLDTRILSSEWMLIGRQEITSHGGRVDLLAIGGTKGSDPLCSFPCRETARRSSGWAIAAELSMNDVGLSATEPGTARNPPNTSLNTDMRGIVAKKDGLITTRSLLNNTSIRGPRGT